MNFISVESLSRGHAILMSRHLDPSNLPFNIRVKLEERGYNEIRGFNKLRELPNNYGRNECITQSPK